eukprot:11143471-Prorocentrum_lima.AAC.1
MWCKLPNQDLGLAKENIWVKMKTMKAIWWATGLRVSCRGSHHNKIKVNLTMWMMWNMSCTKT